jgi:hypothetical protein
MNTIVVRKVETRSDFKAFFEFPWTLYAGNPCWTPPLKSMRRHLLDREHDPAWEYMEGEYFVAWQGERPVGTIAGFINHRHNETWHENVGWFGAFEFIDDKTVSRELLAAAEEYVRRKGVDAIRGPATFSFHSEVGVLLNNYDRSPVILMAYTLPYYPEHLEQAGYSKAKDLITWFTTKQKLGLLNGALPEKIARVVERNKERRHITVRPGSKKTIHEDFALIHELYNTAWADNWGFVPLSKPELDAIIKDLKQFYLPEITFFAFVDGDPAGFVLAIPDMNQAIRRAYPHPAEPEILTLLKILWHWKLRPKIDTARVMLLGIKEQYRKIGVDGVLFLELFGKVHSTPYTQYSAGWVLEDNADMNLFMPNYTQVDFRYRIYQKVLK